MRADNADTRPISTSFPTRSAESALVEDPPRPAPLLPQALPAGRHQLLHARPFRKKIAPDLGIVAHRVARRGIDRPDLDGGKVGAGLRMDRPVAPSRPRMAAHVHDVGAVRLDPAQAPPALAAHEVPPDGVLPFREPQRRRTRVPRSEAAPFERGEVRAAETFRLRRPRQGIGACERQREDGRQENRVRDLDKGRPPAPAGRPGASDHSTLPASRKIFATSTRSFSTAR